MTWDEELAATAGDAERIAQPVPDADVVARQLAQLSSLEYDQRRVQEAQRLNVRVATLDDVIDSAADPVARLKPGLETSLHWDPEQFEFAVQLMPTVHAALLALRDTGFVNRYREETLPDILAAIESDYAPVVSHDVVPEQERLLGRDLDPRIEILIVRYAKPYGIRVLGQRFVAYYGWDAETQLRIAAPT